MTHETGLGEYKETVLNEYKVRPTKTAILVEINGELHLIEDEE